MNRRLIRTTKLLSLIALVSITFGNADAKEITVTCDTVNKCIMTPSAGDALFDQYESDNTKMLPGDSIERTITFVNNTNEGCAMYLGKITNISIPSPTPADFPSKMWTALSTAYSIPFGGVFGGQATDKATLQDLFNSSSVNIVKVPAMSSEKVQWLVKFDPATGNSYQKSEVWFDFDMVFECDAIPPEERGFTVSKTNGSWPTMLTTGDEVTYQIKIVTGDLPLRNVTVTDLPPDSVDYNNGSWEVISNLRGNLGSAGIILEPHYASPGVWEIDSMEANESIKLTYTGTVQKEASDGVYKDLVWAAGYTILEEESKNNSEELILADAVSSNFAINNGIVNDYFAGTQILVEKTVPVEEEEVSIKTEEKEVLGEQTGEVLGAATLPATGADSFLTATIVGLAIIKLVSLLKQRRLAEKTITISLFALFLGVALLTFNQNYANAAASSLVIRISEPKSPINTDFKIDFVALSTDNKTINIKCLKKSPNETGFTEFSSVALKAGGNSGVCNVGTGILNKEGTYDFKVTASTTDETTEEIIYVNYKDEGPERPEYIKKSKNNSCEYEITVKTAKDTETEYVEVYRSDKKSFLAEDSTRIKTLYMGANEKETFIHLLYGSDCGDSYYAVRAFDGAGNPSSARSEIVEDLIVITAATEQNEEISAFGLLLRDEEVSELQELEQGGKVAGESKEGTETTKPGDIEKETKTTAQEEEEKVLGTENKRFGLWWLALLALLIIGIIFNKKRKNIKDALPPR